MSTQRDDDYLVCGEYQERIDQRSSEYPGFITFQHPNGNHYFAWVNGNDIVLRSEAYPDADKMERGIKAILKNCDLAERYSVDVQHGAHFLILWGGGDHQKHTGNMEGHNEIGRSCPKRSREELNALLQFKGSDFANRVVPIQSSEAKVVASTSAESSRSESSHSFANTSSSNDGPSVASDTGGGGLSWLKWLLPLLAIGGALWYWQCCRKDGSVPSAEVPKADTTIAMAPMTAAETFAKEMGVTLTGAAKDGIENQLIGFIKDTFAKVNDTTWFNFDRLLFDTGKATLQAGSEVQLTNMAAILNAFPKVKLKIGGYTDNQGNPKSNMKLSSDRANTVMAALVKLGTDAARLKAEGYGEKHPVGDNNTEEGRQQNRRIAVRVTEK